MEEKEKIKILIEKGWRYDPQTGQVFSHTGKEIKNVNSDGYICCQLKYNDIFINIKAHRLGYYIHHGEIKGQIDHINGNRSDNRLINLRDISKIENSQHRTTAKGVYWHKKTKKYYTKIVRYGKVILGNYHNTAEEARNQYLELKAKYNNKNLY